MATAVIHRFYGSTAASARPVARLLDHSERGSLPAAAFPKTPDLNHVGVSVSAEVDAPPHRDSRVQCALSPKAETTGRPLSPTPPADGCRCRTSSRTDVRLPLGAVTSSRAGTLRSSWDRLPRTLSPACRSGAGMKGWQHGLCPSWSFRSPRQPPVPGHDELRSPTPPGDAHTIMDRAHDVGINFFDTANRYGGAFSPPGQVANNDQSHPGWTEEIIGDWFASGGGRRERTVLATKLYGAMGDWPNEDKLSALNIRRACDASLRRLRTDYIDLYQMHHVDRDTPWDEIWQAMEVLVAQGKILYAGSSNFAGWHIAQANDAAAARDFFGRASEQSIYNLMTRDIELEVLPAAISSGVGVIPWSPLQGGLLGGVLKKEREGRRRLSGRAQETIERSREQIEAYENLCDEIGEEPGSVALAWLLHQDGVTGPIIGPRTAGQLEDAQRAVSLKLDDKVLERLDSIFPGYRPAPENYAW